MGANENSDSGNILVVDDEKSIQNTLVREFTFYNFKVYTAKTAGHQPFHQTLE